MNRDIKGTVMVVDDDPYVLESLSTLLAEIGTQLRPKREFLELRVPHEQAAVIARLHAVGQIISRSYRGPAARFKARIPPHHHDEFAPYIVRDRQATP